MVTDPSNEGKMAFLDMSLDEIITLRKITDTSTEERKTGTENHKKNYLISGQQSNAEEHHWERGHSRFRNNDEERNGIKSNQELFGFKFGQSPLNRQPLIKQNCGSLQDKCNDNSKAQGERNQHQLEGSKSQSEKNRYYSERSRGQSERYRGRAERSHHQSEGFHGQSERNRGQVERSRSYTERSHGQSGRSCGHSKRFYGRSERSPDHLKRSHVLAKRSYGQSRRFYGQSERSHDQSRRYRSYSPVGIESEFDRTFATKKKSEYLWKKMQQRNYPRNMIRRMSPENDHSSYENFRRRERNKRRGVKASLITTKHNITKSSQHHYRGRYPEFNFQGIGNQTKLSLHERFSNLKK